MDITFWCSDRRVCTPQQWTEDHPHEPWHQAGGAQPIRRRPVGVADHLSRSSPGTTDGKSHDRGASSWAMARLQGVAADREVAPVERERRCAGMAVAAPARDQEQAAAAARPAPRSGDDRRDRAPPPAGAGDLVPHCHFRETISVEALARRVRLKPSRFQQLFRRLYGTGVYAHAWPRRIDVAFRLHAPMGTTVDCEFRDGRIARLSVDPPERAADIEFAG